MGLYDDKNYQEIGEVIFRKLQFIYNNNEAVKTQDAGQWIRAVGVQQNLQTILKDNVEEKDALNLRRDLELIVGGNIDVFKDTIKIQLTIIEKGIIFDSKRVEERLEQKLHPLITALEETLAGIPELAVLKTKKQEVNTTLIATPYKSSTVQFDFQTQINEIKSQLGLQQNELALTKQQLDQEQQANSHIRNAVSGFMQALIQRSQQGTISGVSDLQQLTGYQDVQQMGLISYPATFSTTAAQSPNTFFASSSQLSKSAELDRFEKTLERWLENGKVIDTIKLTNRSALIQSLITYVNNEENNEYAAIAKMTIYYLVIWKYSHSIKEVESFLVEQLNTVNSGLPKSIMQLMHSVQEDDLKGYNYHKDRQLVLASEIKSILVLHTGGVLQDKQLVAYMPKDEIAEKCYEKPYQINYFEMFKEIFGKVQTLAPQTP